jgi:hypothetical protein
MLVEVAGIAIRQEFDESDRLFNLSLDPYMGQTIRIFIHIATEKEHKPSQQKCLKYA